MKLSQPFLYRVYGWLILIAGWFIISNLGLVNNHILPTPQKTVSAFIGLATGGDLYNKMNLWEHLWFSVKLNLLAYFECVAASLIFGFAIGLHPGIRKMFSFQVNALRFVPITALMGIFVAIFGITVVTKINFLAFGIWVYLVPVVVQRIDEVNNVHLQMMKTLGASFGQTFKHVIWPSVISRLSDDIRILVGISWTYIIVAELAGMVGGVGSLIWLGQKNSNIGITYAVIIIIVIFGISQDAAFRRADRFFFKHKYV